MKNIEGYTSLNEIYSSEKKVIFRAINLKNNEPVVLKLLNTDHPSREEISRLENEFSIINRIKDPGVIKANSIISLGYNKAIEMEDFNGISLKDYLNSKQFNINDYLTIFISITNTLNEIHKKNIIHKDIKPSNILINPETKDIKIIDFSIASLVLKEIRSAINPERLEGTLAYMSPEQTGRMNRSIDFRTDFYSLGITIYELLTGDLPFKMKEPMELVHAHIAQEPVEPHKINHDIPLEISEIIMKLLSKTAGDRYQSAAGLKSDLEICLNQLTKNGIIKDFQIGKNDKSEQLQIPEKLYGREEEIKILFDEFEESIKGNSRLILFSGPPGIGKSFLINEIQRHLIKGKGFFISGKYDQYKKDIPYSSFIQAFHILIRQILTESENKIKLWKESILKYVRENGQIIVDVIPELELIIGAQKSTPKLPPTESNNRFNHVFRNFMKIFKEMNQPLVLFLDDLQWTDSASLNLMNIILKDNEIKNFLLIGAFRDNEIYKTHPFQLLLDNLKDEKYNWKSIILKPLKNNYIDNLIKETFNSSNTKSKLLSEIVAEKTGGNPFFVKEFIKSLFINNYITFNKSWHWDIDSIQKADITDNVVELMIEKIKNLPEEAQKILKIASCIGNSFNFDVISSLLNEDKNIIFKKIIDAINEGLVTKLDDNLKFSHDRVREAVYTSLNNDERNQIHYSIGKFLLSKESKEKFDEEIFTIVNHLNEGIGLIKDQKEKTYLSQLNQIAGLKAKYSIAYKESKQYLLQGIDLLPTEPWESEHDLTSSLFIELGELGYLISDEEEADKYFDVLLKNSKNVLDKARVYEIKIVSYTVSHKMKEAIQMGKEALKMLGVKIPKKGNQLSVVQEILAVKTKMRNKQVEDLIDLPELKDPQKLAITGLLMSLAEACYIGDPKLLPVLLLKVVNLSLKHGNSIYSPYAYIVYGLILCGAFVDIDQGYLFGKLALKVVKKFDARRAKSQVYFAYANMINHWKNHLKEDMEYNLMAYRSGIETGVLSFASYAINHYMIHSIFINGSLNITKENYDKYFEDINALHQLSSIQVFKLWYQLVINLAEETENKFEISGNIFKESEIIPEWKHINDLTAMGMYTVCKQLNFYIYNDFKNSIRSAIDGENYLESILGMILVPEYYFYYSLSMTAHYPKATKKEKRSYIKIIKKNQKKMKKWAQHAPMNYEHKYLLVKAELGNILNKDFSETINIYENAILLAQQNNYIQDEAIANECAARFCISRKMNKFASLYINESLYLYKRWGAKVKVKDIEEKYLKFLFTSSVSTSNEEEDSDSSGTASLDINTIMRSSQTISSEIKIELLLKELMKIIIENAGAQHGVLILDHDGKFYVEAEGTASNDKFVVKQMIPVENFQNIPQSIVNYVKRTQETIVLDDALHQGIFVEDPYVQKNRIRSVLCVPLVRQQKLIGIIYLENNLTAKAFPLKRRETIKHLSTQAAISIENAMLFERTIAAEKEMQQQYEEMQSQYDEMEALNEKLETIHSELMNSNDNLAIFKKFAETSGQGFSMSHLTGDIIYVNSSFSKMAGLKSPKEAIGNNITSYYTVDNREYFKEKTMDTIIEKGQWIGELPLLTIDGNQIPAIQNIFLIRDNMDQPQFIGSIITNTTKLLMTEKALRESEERNRNLIETMKDGIAVLDKSGNLTYANKALSDMLGYTHKEIINTSMSNYMNEDNKLIFKKQLENRKKGVADTYELEWIRKDGFKIHTIVSPQILFNEDGNYSGSFGVITDITEKRHLEKQLQQAQKMEAIGNLAGGIAHDFNNFLTAITGYSGLMLTQMEKEDPLIHNVNEIMKAAERSAALTRQLLAFSRNQILKSEILDLNDIVIDMERMLTRLIGEDIELITDLYPNLQYTNIDKGQIEQTIMNLVVNARDAMPNGGKLTIRTRNIIIDEDITSEIPEAMQGEYVQLIIKDTGLGMDSTILNQIFDPFFTTKDIGHGTGLGLSVVYGIIKQHEGWINVKSTPDNGCTFEINLPVVTSKIEEKIESKPLSSTSIKGNGEFILLVEDQIEVRKFAELALSKNGYNVISCETIKEALEKFKDSAIDYDLIFSDVVLPDGSGTNLIDIILGENPDMKVLLTSGYSDKKSQTEIIFEKGHPFLQKPYSLEGLLDKISQIISISN